ncbi:MAG TPA: dihydroorotate dehydrogenase-like protein [Gaiellaceae bacterium]|nr:dihydroorotate dehydrogenase-like protein [Gaiellaceae bacterium]
MTPDLATTYLGLHLRSPVLASSSPLTGDLDALLELEEHGIGAAVLPSLFEEQIEHEQMDLHDLLEHKTHSFAEAPTWFPELDDYNTGPEAYLEHLREAKAALGVPVFASLNGVSTGGWLAFARRCEEAGADALELNVYAVETGVGVSAAEVEERTLALVREVRRAVSIPLAVKVGPFYTAFAHMARRLSEAGADGLVLFNRFLQPDIDLESLAVSPTLELSTPAELRLPLRWTAILRGRVPISLAGTSGVHDWRGVAKLLLAGADAVSVASAVLERGPSAVSELLDGLRSWMVESEYTSVEQLKGSLSQGSSPDPDAFERGNYMLALVSYAPQPESRGRVRPDDDGRR